MNADLECIPCFLKQTIEASRMATTDRTRHIEAVKKVMMFLTEQSFDISPPDLSKEIHHIIREVTHNADPYLKVKNQH